MASQDKPCRIMVVDDHRDAAESLARLLDVMGYDVRYTTDPREALGLARAFQPRIAFLDIGMPHVDGYQLAAALRATPELEAMSIVAITAYGEPQHRALSRKAGFDAHIQKPIGAPLLESMLAHFLEA